MFLDEVEKQAYYIFFRKSVVNVADAWSIQKIKIFRWLTNAWLNRLPIRTGQSWILQFNPDKVSQTDETGCLTN